MSSESLWLLAELASELSTATDLSALQHILGRKLRWLFDFDRCTLAIRFKSTDLDYLLLEISNRSDGSPPPAQRFPLTAGWPGRVLREAKPYFIADLSQPSSEVTLIEGECGISAAAGSLMLLPLQSGELTLGSLNFSANHANAYSATWRSLASLLAAQVAGQLGSILAHQRLQQQAERESLLGGITLRIRHSLNLEDILNATVREVRQLLSTDRVVVYQFDGHWQGKVTVEEVVSPWPSALGASGQENCFSQGYAPLYQGGRVRAIPDIQQAGLDPCHVDFLRKLAVQASLIVPILTGSRLWGLLIAHECRAPRLWQDSDLKLLQQLADHIAIAIQQAELYSQIQASARQSREQAQKLSDTLEELRTTQMQLIQSEKMSSLGLVVAGIAHEINNTINFIHANLPYAQDYVAKLSEILAAYQVHNLRPPPAIAKLQDELELDYIRQDFPKLFRSMQEGSERIRAVILTLRNFSRLDEAERKSVDLHEGLESSLLILQYRFKKGCQLTRHYSALPLVECYASQINQVLLNLLSNALDAAGEQGEVTITTTWSAPDWVTIAIQDNGPGIPAEIQPQIFEPFFTTKEMGKGTGLGLSICRKVIVEGHGGQIHCISSPGRGAEFRLELPLYSQTPRPF